MKLLKWYRLFHLILFVFIYNSFVRAQIPLIHSQSFDNQLKYDYASRENKYSISGNEAEKINLNRNYLRQNLNELNFKIEPDLILLNRNIRGRQFEEVMGMILMISTGPLLLGTIVNSSFGSDTTTRNFGIGAACTGIAGIALFVDGRIHRKLLQQQKDLIIEEYMVSTP